MRTCCQEFKFLTWKYFLFEAEYGQTEKRVVPLLDGRPVLFTGRWMQYFNEHQFML